MKTIVAFGADIKSQAILAVGDVAAEIENSSRVFLTGGVAENVSASAGRAHVYEATLLAKGNIAVKQ